MQQKNSEKQIEWLEKTVSILEDIKIRMDNQVIKLVDANIDTSDNLPEIDGHSDTRLMIDLIFRTPPYLRK